MRAVDEAFLFHSSVGYLTVVQDPYNVILIDLAEILFPQLKRYETKISRVEAFAAYFRHIFQISFIALDMLF